MKKILQTILLVFISVNLLWGQKTFENKQFGFSIQEPPDWIVATNQELNKNLQKFDFTEDGLAKIFAAENGSVLLTAFYKYDTKKHIGLIPTIQIRVQMGSAGNFRSFKNAITRSAYDMKNIFPDYEFIEAPREIQISGITSVKFISRFTLKTQKGDEMKVRGRTIAIPYKNYFFQLNFTDGQTGEDAGQLFDELIKTIKIGNL